LGRESRKQTADAQDHGQNPAQRFAANPCSRSIWRPAVYLDTTAVEAQLTNPGMPSNAPLAAVGSPALAPF